jgi:hypothetical protein
MLEVWQADLMVTIMVVVFLGTLVVLLVDSTKVLGH